MQSHLPCTERSEQHLWGSDAKSYTCSFCKKGFSNAQALGGHMNIHRKDRAKLKQSSDENLVSTDTTKTSDPSDIHPRPSADDNSSLVGSSEEKSCTLKRQWISNKEDDAIPGELQKQPLFVEKLSENSGLKARSAHIGGHEEKTMQMGHGSSQTELDLELRLGPEPRETSTTGIREFF